MKNYYEAMG